MGCLVGGVGVQNTSSGLTGLLEFAVPVNRKLRTGAFSLLLTMVWAVGLCLLMVRGWVGLQPSPPNGLALAGIVCAVVSGLLLTLACFPSLAECLRPVAQVAAVGAALDTAALVWNQLPATTRIPDILSGLEYSDALLLPSMIALVASSVLFLTRWFSSQASRSRFQPLGALQANFLVFHRHHRLLGWLALALAGAHSVYFLLRPGADFEQWTGIAATALLGAVGLIGLVTSYKTFIRLWAHRIVATLVIVALALHWSPFIPTATAVLVGLSAAGLIHLKAISVLAALSRQAAA